MKHKPVQTQPVKEKEVIKVEEAINSLTECIEKLNKIEQNQFFTIGVISHHLDTIAYNWPTVKDQINLVSQKLPSLELNLKSVPNFLAKVKSDIKLDIGKLQKDISKLESENLSYENKIEKAKNEVQTKQLKLVENNQIDKPQELDLVEKIESNTNMLKSISINERSFILQQALINKDHELSYLILNEKVDPNFRNKDGVSLMQTANKTGNKLIIEKLLPFAEFSSHFTVSNSQNAMVKPTDNILQQDNINLDEFTEIIGDI